MTTADPNLAVFQLHCKAGIKAWSLAVQLRIIPTEIADRSLAARCAAIARRKYYLGTNTAQSSIASILVLATSAR
ncbi:hypothetical protein [Thalassolituus sp.]|uniref:hypothetical protein n=1 Tax=Thalassolituus sp. TaxID=2030822 RepID=UPI0039828940